MSHIEIHVIKGRQYKYEVTNYRVGKRVKHKWKYLGAVHPINNRRNPNAGRKPKLKVRELAFEERDFVSQNLKNSKSFIKDRARIINLSFEGKTIKQIAQQLNFHRPKIEKIIKQFNQLGLKIFERKKNPGKPRRITEEQRAAILQFVNTNPMKLGLHFTNWSLNKIASHANKQGIQISPSQVRRIIKADNIKYKKKIPWLYSNDPDFAKKNSK